MQLQWIDSNRLFYGRYVFMLLLLLSTYVANIITFLPTEIFRGPFLCAASLINLLDDFRCGNGKMTTPDPKSELQDANHGPATPSFTSFDMITCKISHK